MPKRRRGSRSGRLTERHSPTRHRRFEDLVSEVLAAIPMPFAAALDEVAIVIDDEPRRPLRNELGPTHALRAVLGRRPDRYGPTYRRPNRISLFRLPSRRISPTGLPRRLSRLHRITAWPPLGIDDYRLHSLGIE